MIALPNCSGGDRLRLVCMGKGMLQPDTRTLLDCEVPVFKTHPTPVNVSVKPETVTAEAEKTNRSGGGGGGAGGGDANNAAGGGNDNNMAQNTTSQGCACIVL